MEKIKDQPHAKAWEMMWKSPRCQAKCRTRNYQACRNLAMANGRCRMHGGRATGAKTVAGKINSRNANWKHGYYSREVADYKQLSYKEIKRYRELLQQVHNRMTK